jgi:hypothetical protein
VGVFICVLYALHVDATGPVLPHLRPLIHITPITSLHELEFEVSACDCHGWTLTAAAFISRVCPNALCISTNVPWAKSLRWQRARCLPAEAVLLDAVMIAHIEQSAERRTNLHWRKIRQHIAMIDGALHIRPTYLDS